MEELVLKINEETVGVRLDKYLKDNFEDLSRGYIQELIDEGYVLVNGKSSKNSYKTCLNDEIIVTFKEDTDLNVEAQDIPLNIV